MNVSDSFQTGILLFLAAALVHGTFQLGVSVLTLLSGHSLGAKKAHRRLLILNGGYIIGSLSMVALLLLSSVYVIDILITPSNERIIWSITGIVAALSGFFITLAYYRKGRGTLLWIPRMMAEYLSKRAKKTRSTSESFALGAMTVLAELPFALAPLLIAALVITNIAKDNSLAYITLYVFISGLPLLLIASLIGAGERLSVIQKWRESYKSFLQYSAGLGLILMSCYITAFYLLGGSR